MTSVAVKLRIPISCYAILALAWLADCVLPPGYDSRRTDILLCIGVLYWALTFVPQLLVMGMAMLFGSNRPDQAMQPPFVHLTHAPVGESVLVSVLLTSVAVAITWSAAAFWSRRGTKSPVALRWVGICFVVGVIVTCAHLPLVGHYESGWVMTTLTPLRTVTVPVFHAFGEPYPFRPGAGADSLSEFGLLVGGHVWLVTTLALFCVGLIRLVTLFRSGAVAGRVVETRDRQP
jgi:hypothetical protein